MVLEAKRPKSMVLGSVQPLGGGPSWCIITTERQSKMLPWLSFTHFYKTTNATTGTAPSQLLLILTAIQGSHFQIHESIKFKAFNMLHWGTYSSHSNRLTVYQHACTNTSYHMVSLPLWKEQIRWYILSVWPMDLQGPQELIHREESLAWVYNSLFPNYQIHIPTYWQAMW